MLATRVKTRARINFLESHRGAFGIVAKSKDAGPIAHALRVTHGERTFALTDSQPIACQYSLHLARPACVYEVGNTSQVAAAAQSLTSRHRSCSMSWAQPGEKARACVMATGTRLSSEHSNGNSHAALG
jgi:hypothetical protein